MSPSSDLQQVRSRTWDAEAEVAPHRYLVPYFVLELEPCSGEDVNRNGLGDPDQMFGKRLDMVQRLTFVRLSVNVS